MPYTYSLCRATTPHLTSISATLDRHPQNYICLLTDYRISVSSFHPAIFITSSRLQCSQPPHLYYVILKLVSIFNIPSTPSLPRSLTFSVTHSPLPLTLPITHSQYANKAWSEECGWDNHEVLGLTCSFLQGEVNHRVFLLLLLSITLVLS